MSIIKRGISCLKQNGFRYTCSLAFKKVFHSDKMKNQIHIDREKKDKGLSDDAINIGLLTGGGFGDNLVFVNYVYCLKEKFKDLNICIDIYFGGGYSLAGSLLNDDSFYHKYYEMKDGGCAQLYDWFAWVGRYPQTYNYDEKKIRSKSKDLADYIESCQKFEEDNKQIFDTSPYMDGVADSLCALRGVTRIQQPDVNGILGIGKDFRYQLKTHCDEKNYLESVDLFDKFITVHRGSDVTYSKNVTKLWPLENYNELIAMFKKRYPGYKIVQLGVSRERCPKMDGVDIDLVGKTTMEHVKVLLNNSSLHIDGEGGFVHARKSMGGGQSVVLFGPTSCKFYGYDGNINIVGNGCDRECEWLTKNWLDKCPRGYEAPPCMSSISPNLVMCEIDKKWEHKL